MGNAANGNGKKFWGVIALIPVAVVVGAIFHSGFYVGQVMANTRQNEDQELEIAKVVEETNNQRVEIVKLRAETEAHYAEILRLLNRQDEDFKEIKQDIKTLQRGE